jgi:hypothetical protein
VLKYPLASLFADACNFGMVVCVQDVLVGLLRLRQASGRIQHERQPELRGRWVGVA